MLALSIFCSSQTISVALYNGKRLEFFYKKKILNGKIDGIFSIIKKCQKSYSFINLKYIICTKGPGSFTAIRSLKSICQALALFSGAKIFSSSTFIPFFVNDLNKSSNFIVIFKSSEKKYFFQMFQIKNNKIEQESKLAQKEIPEILNFYLIKKKKIKNLSIIVDDIHIKKGFPKNAVKYYEANAKDLAKSFFGGFCEKNLDIFYHSTYYE